MSSDAGSYAQGALAAGSQSFAAAAKLFNPAMRRDATLLYAWCRHCDDVIDGQQFGHNQMPDRATAAQRLIGLERDTQDALESSAVQHPAFHGLPGLAERHAIPRALFFAHLDGFRYDIEGRRYATLSDLLGYCYGVAGTVGLMMAYVMGAKKPATLDRACDLGLAFQLTNIARDVMEDARAGRIYLPLDWLAEAGVPSERIEAQEFRPALAQVAARVVLAAEPYYDSAAQGLADLPFRAAWTIGMAKEVYRAIGRKVLARGASAWTGRARTSGAEKLALAGVGISDAFRSRVRERKARPAELWKRPDEFRLEPALAHEQTGHQSARA